jgi:cyclopropane-fatty-acyl-phospholipid synthase
MTSPVHSGADVGAPTDRTTSQPPQDAQPGGTRQIEPTPVGRELQAPARTPRVYAAEKWLVRRLLRRLGNPAIRVALWDGQQITLSDQPPVATVRIHDRRTLLGLIVNPEVHFGDAYTDGRIEVDGDLLALLQTVFRAMWPTLTATGSLRGWLWYWLGRLHSNTAGRARRNVHHHYDIRGEFYRLWLDEQLVYTCAYFPDPAMTIEEAQRAKLDYVCRKLRLRPGETAVEAGFGWGALALHMARHYGVTVRAYNLSHEQVLFAQQRAKAEGLASQVEFIEDDYRNISGRYDVFVSVGMLEHVGPKHYRTLGEVIDRCLKPAGRGLIHSIGRNQPARRDAWIDRRIFPPIPPRSAR